MRALPPTTPTTTTTTPPARPVEIPPLGTAIAPQAANDGEMLELWLRRHRNTNTQDAYARDARAFQAFVAKPLRAVIVRDVEDFADSLAGLAPATQARRLSAVKSLIGYACRLRYLPLDVGAPVQLPKIEDKLAEKIMGEGDVLRMLDRVRHPRNAALLKTLYVAGLRVSEACALRWRNMIPRVIQGREAGQLAAFGKGGKTRLILLPPRLWAQLTALRGNAGPEDFVFRSRKGGGLRRGQVHVIIKGAAARAGLSPAISAHWLRHAHVSHALNRNVPIHLVQTTVGHASLSTTTKYTHANPDDLSALHLAAG